MLDPTTRAASGRGSGRFAYAQKVPEVVALVRELHGQRQSLRQISKTLAAQGHLTGGGRPYTATGCRRCCEADREAEPCFRPGPGRRYTALRKAERGRKAGLARKSKIAHADISGVCSARLPERPAVFCSIHRVNAASCSFPAASHCWASLMNIIHCCGSSSCTAARQYSFAKNSQSSFSTVLAMSVSLRR